MYRINPGNVVEIVDIVTKSEYRGCGHGRRLLEQFFKEDEIKDCTTVYAVTRASNLIAQQFYEKCGFEVTAVLRRFYSRVEPVADAIMYGRSPQGPI